MRACNHAGIQAGDVHKPICKLKLIMNRVPFVIYEPWVLRSHGSQTASKLPFLFVEFLSDHKSGSWVRHVSINESILKAMAFAAHFKMHSELTGESHCSSGSMACKRYLMGSSLIMAFSCHAISKTSQSSTSSQTGRFKTVCVLWVVGPYESWTVMNLRFASSCPYQLHVSTEWRIFHHNPPYRYEW